LYCLTKKTNSTFEVDEKYQISCVVKVKIRENQLRIHLYPDNKIIFIVEDKDEANDWAYLITKLKQDWSNQNDQLILFRQLLSDKFEEAQYWQLHSMENPEHWIALGDIYKRKKMVKEAIACYEKARIQLPADYPLLYKLAKMYLSTDGNQRKGKACLATIKMTMECTSHIDLVICLKTVELLKRFKEEQQRENKQ